MIQHDTTNLISANHNDVLGLESEICGRVDHFIFFDAGHAIRREKPIVLFHAQRLTFLSARASVDWKCSTKRIEKKIN